MLQKNGITILENNTAAVRLGLDCTPLASQEIKQLSISAPEKLEDLMPKDSDYVNIPFRSLTAKYLGESGYFLDFSQENVLKDSIPLIMTAENGGQRKKPLKVQRNHSFDIEDTLGTVPKAWWDNSEEFSAPGINVMSRLDWKMYPNEVRKLLSNPPLIESSSWAFMFSWQQSHPDMKWWQFMDLLGHEVDGEVVCLIVTEISEYYHFGLVWAGGDDEAVQTGQTPLNPPLKKGGLGGLPVPYSDVVTTELDKKTKIKQPSKEEMMEEIIIKNLSSFQDVLGLDGVSDEAELLSAVQGLNDAVEKLRKDVKTLKPKAELGETYLKDTREEVLRLAKIVHNGELEETREELILKANLETLQMLEKDYRTQEAKLFPSFCQDCGSQNIQLRSSREEAPAEGDAAADVNEGQYKTGM